LEGKAARTQRAKDEAWTQKHFDELSFRVQECVNCSVTQFAVTYFDRVPREAILRLQSAMKKQGIVVLYDEYLSPLPNARAAFQNTVTFRIGRIKPTDASETSILARISGFINSLTDAELWSMGLRRNTLNAWLDERPGWRPRVIDSAIAIPGSELLGP
jgi:hypothetical protein